MWPRDSRNILGSLSLPTPLVPCSTDVLRKCRGRVGTKRLLNDAESVICSIIIFFVRTREKTEAWGGQRLTQDHTLTTAEARSIARSRTQIYSSSKTKSLGQDDASAPIGEGDALDKSRVGSGPLILSAQSERDFV